ncbi:TetR/AcrR family transcriptional regulator [Cohnella hongkongensis]|uniref:TetR/AcrR family transcriptional regulator n=1 Tax=Cohnella hongkongensis TaxID=178337 RepID=A0ABV9FGR7_9BACL
MADSLIAEARREQIIRACIDTLEEVGYNNLSLTKVARKAGISTGLISYHFHDKLDLINHTLHFLVAKQLDFISGKVVLAHTPTGQLEAYIEAHLAYQETHSNDNIALIEIVFNARNEDDVAYYRMGEENEEDELKTMLLDILKEGQQKDEFTQSFQPEIVASIIAGAIEERMLRVNSPIPTEQYADELIKMVKRLIV